jgi:paraquat-inducible protein B
VSEPPPIPGQPQPQLQPQPPLGEARRIRSLWPGLVWALPLSALLVVAYLGIQALAHRGVEAVVTFASASGAKPGDTKVVYQGLEVGSVAKVSLNKDGRRVDMVLRLDPRAAPVLNTSTRFWLIGAKPNLADIDSVRAALAGVTIGMAPGPGGDPTRHFVGLEQPPIVTPGTKGQAYVLNSKVLGPVRAGAVVLYHGQEIGKVTATRFNGVDSFRLDIFIYRPFDALIRPGAMFWNASPLQVSLTGSGLSTNIGPADSVFSGALDFDLSPSDAEARPSPAGSSFYLYSNKGEAQAGQPGPPVLYNLVFKGPAGDMGEGAPVRLNGFPVGEVQSVKLAFDRSDGAPYAAVVAALYPARLGISTGGRAATDAMVNSLLRRGYRARLAQSPPLIGGRSIALEKGKVGAAALVMGAKGPDGAYPLLPSDAGGADLDDLTSQADQILAKVNRIPIEAIGQDVRQITGRLNTLMSSPQLTDSLKHLDGTLTQVDQMVSEVKPQVGPLITKLNTAADQITGVAHAANGVLSGDGAGQDASLPDAIRQLTEAARSIRSLADYLGRHPEAVIKGKVKDGK